MNDKTPQDLNDQLIDDLLEGDIPQADPTMKKQAINMASKEFSETFAKNSQESLDPARPIDNRDITSTTSSRINARWLSVLTKSIRSFFMNPINNPIAYKGFVAAGVAFLAVSVIFITPSTQTTSLEELSRVATQTADTNIETRIEPVTDEVNEEIVVTARKVESRVNEAPVNITVWTAEALESKDVFESDISVSLSGTAPVVAAASGLRAREASISQPRPNNTEEFAEYQTNPIKLVADEPVSTFSIDVDTASYSLVRNQLNSGFLPAEQAVRVEEFINYFDYDYPTPSSNAEPFQPTINVFDSPWNEDRKLVHIGIKGYDIETNEQPDSNLVFLLDVSGSMNAANKLPLVKQSVNLLLDTLKPTDTVSIVVYAGAAGTVLEPTKVSEKNKIITALQDLSAGGSTAGGAGIQLAYQLAEQNFDEDAVNRIILATDGDFNVGRFENEELQTLVESKRDSGVFLSILGFGRNNYQDDMMQTLGQNGNGVAAYIDSLSEAKKVLVDEATSTLFPIAKDVKIQVEFNPTTVSEYRLIGYETRSLNREDFNNDKVDAGDIGAGHTVTAIYEITPTGSENQAIDEVRYSVNRATTTESQSDEYGFLKMRYKLPNSDTSLLIETPINTATSTPSNDVQFSVAVAGFAQLLSGSQYTGDLDYAAVIANASDYKGDDPFGYRSEFIQLVRMAEIAKP